MNQCYAVIGSGGWFEILGADIELRQSCSEVKRGNSCGLIWRGNQEGEGGSCCQENQRTD